MRLELDQTGERLDAAIARLVPELSRSQAQRLLEEGLVTFEGKPFWTGCAGHSDVPFPLSLHCTAPG